MSEHPANDIQRLIEKLADKRRIWVLTGAESVQPQAFLPTEITKVNGKLLSQCSIMTLLPNWLQGNAIGHEVL